MTFYALQVQTGEEDEFLRRAQASLPPPGRFFLPKRALSIKRRGKIVDVKLPVFSGYVFLSCESKLDSLYHYLKRVPGFLRFLPSNEAIHPLSEQDLQLIRHFMSFGECADKSKASFDENDRIVIHSGPLKGYEGQIVKVDKRKGRAKLRIEFCNSSITLDLGFELIERKGDGGSDGGIGTEQDLHNRGGLRGTGPGQGDRA